MSLVPCEFKRSKKSKSIKLFIGYQNQVVITVPWNCPYQEALNFLNSKGTWIEKQLDCRDKVQSLLDYLLKKPTIYGQGKKWAVEISFSDQSGRLKIETDPATKIHLILQKEHPYEQQIYLLLRKFAHQVLKVRLAELAEKTGLIVKKVRIADQHSRWGSCSETGTISLNWRLILIPSKLQDHILFHELAHLKHMNHSSDYYDYLNTLDSNMKKHQENFQKINNRIMRLGRM